MAYSNRSQLAMLAGEAEPAIDWGLRTIQLAEPLDAMTSCVMPSTTSERRGS